MRPLPLSKRDIVHQQRRSVIALYVHHQRHPPPPLPLTELTAHSDSVADQSFVVRKFGGVDSSFADRLSYFAASQSFNAVPAAASLPRILISPSLKEPGLIPNSQDEATISKKRIASETPNPHKRKAFSKPKPNELSIPSSTKV